MDRIMKLTLALTLALALALVPSVTKAQSPQQELGDAIGPDNETPEATTNNRGIALRGTAPGGTREMVQVDAAGNIITSPANGWDQTTGDSVPIPVGMIGGQRLTNQAIQHTLKMDTSGADDAAGTLSYIQLVATRGYVWDATDGNWDRLQSSGADNGDILVAPTAGTAWNRGTSSTTYGTAEAQVAGATTVVVGASVVCDGVGACSITLREVWDAGPDCDEVNAAQVTHMTVGAPESSTAAVMIPEPFSTSATGLCVDQGANVASWTVFTR